MKTEKTLGSTVNGGTFTVDDLGVITLRDVTGNSLCSACIHTEKELKNWKCLFNFIEQQQLYEKENDDSKEEG